MITKKIKCVSFYDTSICEFEGYQVVKFKDRKGLYNALDNYLFNLDETSSLEIKIQHMTKKQWADARKRGKEME